MPRRASPHPYLKWLTEALVPHGVQLHGHAFPVEVQRDAITGCIVPNGGQRQGLQTDGLLVADSLN